MEKEFKYRVLSPREWCGDPNSDFGFEIDGVKSEKGYVSRAGAKVAMYRKLFKLQADGVKMNICHE